MKNEPIFNWDEESGTSSCILSDGEKIYTGFAQCHPDDEDVKLLLDALVSMHFEDIEMN